MAQRRRAHRRAENIDDEVDDMGALIVRHVVVAEGKRVSDQVGFKCHSNC